MILGLGLEGERTRKGMEDCTRLIAYVILIINKSCFHSNQTEREREREREEWWTGSKQRASKKKYATVENRHAES